MANEYVDVDDLKATLNVGAGTTYLDDDLAAAVETASRAVDLACSRRRLRKFWLDDEDVARLYLPRDWQGPLEINDLVELTSIEAGSGDGTFGDPWVEGTDFTLLPLNAPADGWPWTHLHAGPIGSRWSWPEQDWPFTRWPRVVRVVGKFGWAEVPPGIRDATALLATRLLKRKREAPFGVVGFGADQAAAVHIARTDPDVSGLIQPYLRDATAVSVTVA